jgi:hypothetical protein
MVRATFVSDVSADIEEFPMNPKYGQRICRDRMLLFLFRFMNRIELAISPGHRRA